MRILFQIDHLDSLNLESDTSLFLAYEAEKLGYEIFYTHPKDVFLKNANIYSKITKFSVDFIDNKFSYQIYESSMENLENIDVILIRQNPPFNMEYITNTYFLEMLKHPKIINRPEAIRNCSEKLFLFNFKELIIDTMVTSKIENAIDFLKEHKEIVLKPLYEFGGQGVEKISLEDKDHLCKIENFISSTESEFVVQKFNPEIKNGDKRIILINGEIAGSLNRIPKEGSIKSNLAAGGVASKSEITERDRYIVSVISPRLKERGIYLTGLDVIGGYLNEINITSPTGFLAIFKLYNLNLAKKFWENLVN